MERTAYLGHNLQVVMHKYTEAAVSLTSGLVTFVSRFAVQARLSCSVQLWAPLLLARQPGFMACTVYMLKEVPAYRVACMQVGVSLVLSFMVVWDLPTIAGGVATLKTSRLSAIYKEVAPSLTVFGQLFGKALQAQVRPCAQEACASAL